MAERRLQWLEARHGVLAQNIANADTPGYRSRDLRPFGQALAAASGVTLARTDQRHMAPTHGDGPRPVADRRPVEQTPDGNAVSLDEQAVRIAETETAHTLAVAVHRRYLSFYRLALGHAS